MVERLDCIKKTSYEKGESEKRTMEEKDWIAYNDVDKVAAL